jgi:hypothetical protein
MRHPHPFALLACAVLATAPALAQAPATQLLVIDQDASYVADDNAGALFNLSLSAGTSVAPGLEAGATLGAPFELVSGVALSPIDGRAYIADLGVAPSNVGRIYAADGSDGSVELIWEGAPLVAPFSLAFAPDGRLFIADAEADPSGIGPAPQCGYHGAIFMIDTASCTTPCAPTLVSDGRLHPFGPTVRSAFEEPLGIAYDPVRDRIYVADACASPLGWAGSLYSVVPSSGRVALVASQDRFYSLISVETRPDGTPLIVDQGVAAGDSVVWTVDLSNPDPETNTVELTAGTQYSMIQDVSVDAADNVYIVDWGDYDSASGTYIVPPGIYTIDPTDPDPDTNGVLLNESVEWITPVAGAVVNVPTTNGVAPTTITGPTNVIIQGANLNPSVLLDFGAGIAVSSVDFAPGYPLGTAIQALLTPTNGGIVPAGCSGFQDLTVTHPFGGSSTRTNAVELIGNTGGIVPAAPYSRLGDANRDGIVDGLDLAILGLHFGSTYCEGFAFWNDADFDDNDLIDGQDLARLVAYFGTRP